MAGLLETAARNRAALLRQDRAAGADLLRAYAQVWSRLDGELALLTDAIAAAQSAGVALSEDRWRRITAPRKPLVQALSGETFSEAAARVEVRYRLLRAQLLAEMGRYARTAEGVITAAQRRAITAGLADAEGLLAAATGQGGVGLAFNRLPVGALQELVGVLADGSPLSALLGGLGPQVDAALREALVTGLGLGKGPRAIALDMRRSTNVAAVRALRLSRTEVLRAYRSASQETYRANADVVAGWIWWSALGRRTCPMCYAMHGTFHKLDESFGSHVACRCTQLPSTKGGRLSVTRGGEAFKALPEADQRAILGSGKFAAYQRGDLALDDLVADTRSNAWGRGRRERSLGELGLRRPPAARAPLGKPPLSPAEQSAYEQALARKVRLPAPDDPARYAEILPKVRAYVAKNLNLGVEIQPENLTAILDAGLRPALDRAGMAGTLPKYRGQREKLERDRLGLADRKPVYGTWAVPGERHGYGPLRVELDPSRLRTLTTMGDSLENPKAAIYSDAAAEEIAGDWITKRVARDLKEGFAPDLRTIGVPGQQYIEAQILTNNAPLPPAAIRRIWYDPRKVPEARVAAIRAAVRERGLNIEVLPMQPVSWRDIA